MNASDRHFASARTACLLRLACVALCGWLAGPLLPKTCLAEDITTQDGKTYENVRDIKPMHDGIVVTYGPESSFSRGKLLFRNLSPDLQKKYGYDVFEEGLFNARSDRPISLTLNSAFRLSNLNEAKKKAQEEKKLLGFIMVWDTFFSRPARPMGKSSDNGLAGFYTVFHDGLVLVFVRHEDELGKVPSAVHQGFSGPEEGGWAPNMAVVSADCKHFVCEIPLGGPQSTGATREPIFRQKIAVIKQFIENPPPPAPDPVLQTNIEDEAVQSGTNDSTQGEIIPGQKLESLRSIPPQTRRFYGGIAIGVLVLLVISLRLFRRKSG